ncbi:MAG: hypothetical protein WEE36_02855 [Acidimicrobiia bacterium]
MARMGEAAANLAVQNRATSADNQWINYRRALAADRPQSVVQTGPPVGKVASEFLQMLPIAAYRATTDGIIVERNAALRALLEVDDTAGLDLALLLGVKAGDRVLALLRRHGVADDEIASVAAPARNLRHRAWRQQDSEFIEGILEARPNSLGGRRRIGSETPSGGVLFRCVWPTLSASDLLLSTTRCADSSGTARPSFSS